MSRCKSLTYTPTKNLGSDIITVLVGSGDNSKKFTIHKALLQNSTKYFEKNGYFAGEAGRQNIIFLCDEKPETFEMYHKFVYGGNVEKCKTSYVIKSDTRPSQVELTLLEENCWEVFNTHLMKLVNLYVFAEKYEMEDTMNRAIDNIQDGYHEFGTVFGPLLNAKIFHLTKKGSPLRDLCVGSVLIHFDRGCSQLRNEVMMASITIPDYFPHMLKWISRNFSMFGKRKSVGYDSRRPTKGFSLFNRSALCPCHFHVHKESDRAHRNHQACQAEFKECDHPDTDQEAEESLTISLGFLANQMDIDD